jgi:flagellar biosynthesis protein FliR
VVVDPRARPLITGPWITWGLAALRVLPTLAMVPLAGLGRVSWPLRAVVALVLAAGGLASPPASSTAQWMILVAHELTAGIGLAVVLALPFMALDHAASWLSSIDDHHDALGTLARWTGVAAFLSARGHHGVLRVLAASWEALPPGASAREGAWVEAAVRATGDALAGALVIASSGVVALAALELSVALVARLSSRAFGVSPHLRGAVLTAAFAVALRVSVEVVLELSSRSVALVRSVAV